MFIKRLLSVFIFIIAFSVLTACGNHSNVNNEDSNNDDLIKDTSSSTCSDSNNATDSNDVNIDTTTDTNNEEKNTFGNFSTLHKTIASNDRLKQMKNSKNSYNTGSSYTVEQLKTTRIQASVIASMNFMFPNASELMEHYLDGDGENYELDVEDFLENEIARGNMIKDVNSALRAAEALAVKGQKVTIYQTEESLHHNLTGDLKYALGSYFTSVELYDIKESTMLGVTYYSAKLKYVVQDFYNWDENDTNDVSLTGVSPADLYQLHLNGEAREFLTYGEEIYEIKWVKGIDASKVEFDD